MDLQLQSQPAIVTGGSAAIGLAIARLLAAEGVEGTIPGRNRQKGHEVIASLPGAVHGTEADLGAAAGALTLIAQVPATDTLVNNLGLYEAKPFAAIRDEEWRRYYGVNLLGGIRLARHDFPAMLTRDWGRVMFVSSEAAAETHPDMMRYGVTKTGQVVVSRGLAEMTKGTRVTVNAVLPGPTRSDAMVDYLQGLASTPHVTPAQAEQEFFAKHRPTSLLQRMADDREVAT
jgi:NAD(P)-dependent dehydrogenase (short-subunit alcohol dehydrogenase family)